MEKSTHKSRWENAVKAKLWGGLSLPDIKVYYYGTNSNQGGNGRWIDKWASEIVLKVLKDS